MVTGALQSLLWILKFPLPAVEANMEQLIKHVFVLLKDFAKPGAAKGQNFHLVVNCFKVSFNQRLSSNPLICSIQIHLLARSGSRVDNLCGGRALGFLLKTAENEHTWVALL